MDTAELKKLQKQTLDATQKKRDALKDFYSTWGHRFTKWGRFLDEPETLNIWYISCQECYKHLMYDGNTDVTTVELEKRCPGPPSLKLSPRRIELEKKIALDKQ